MSLLIIMVICGNKITYVKKKFKNTYFKDCRKICSLCDIKLSLFVSKQKLNSRYLYSRLAKSKQKKIFYNFVKYVRLLLLLLRIELLLVFFVPLLFSSYAFKGTNCAICTIFFVIREVDQKL